MSIQDDLFAMQDLSYRSFHSKLMPTVPVEQIIGVRVPQLRAYAEKMEKDEAERFLRSLPHDYYEENNLHAFLINGLQDYGKCIEHLERFLPYVDNWATCDGLRPRCVRHHKQDFLDCVQRWICSDHPYEVRFAIEMLMVHYLDEAFEPRFLEMVSMVDSDHYYVNMMVAWYFATALAKQYDAAIIYIEQRRLSAWIHQKTIQKAIESLRISDAQKQHLKSCK